jgi:hypothetical protein
MRKVGKWVTALLTYLAVGPASVVRLAAGVPISGGHCLSEKRQEVLRKALHK